MGSCISTLSKTPSSQILIFKYLPPVYVISRPGREKSKMVLGHLFAPERKGLKNNMHTSKGKKDSLKSFTLARLWAGRRGGQFKYKIIVTL